MIVTLAQRKAREVERKRPAAAATMEALAIYAGDNGGRFAVFGSFARGDFGPDSDFDVMVEFPAFAEREAHDFAKSICRRFGLVPDVRLASDASEALLRRVQRDGRLLLKPRVLRRVRTQKRPLLRHGASALLLCFSLTSAVAWAEPIAAPPLDATNVLGEVYAALVRGSTGEALETLKSAGSGPDGAAADMIRASLLMGNGPVAEADARALLTERASAAGHLAVFAAPWDCDGRKGPRSSLFDLAALSAVPNVTLIERAADEGDARADLWLGETLLAAGGQSKAARAFLSKAFKGQIAASYYPMAILQTLAAGETRPVDVAANFYLFAITFAVDERAIRDVMAQPPKIPIRVFQQLKARIEAERHEVLSDDAFRNLIAAVVVKEKAKQSARPAWERRFCAVREP